MGGYYRKLILGDPRIAAQYFPIAHRLFGEIERFGVERRVWQDPRGVIVIAKKNVNGERKAIFIVKSLEFIYIDSIVSTPEVSDLLQLGGYSSTLQNNIAQIDITGLPLPASVSFEISPFVNNVAWIIVTEPSGGTFVEQPPIGQIKLTYDGKDVTGVEEPLNYASTAFNFTTVHPGTDRDLIYEAEDNFFGAQSRVALHQRLHADPTSEIAYIGDLPLIDTGTIPAVAMAWPSLGIIHDQFNRYFRANKNKLYINGWQEFTLGVYYSEFWRYDADLNTFAWLYSFNGTDGLRQLYLNGHIEDWLTDKGGFTVSERTDSAGDPSDLELVYVREVDEAWYPAMDTPLFTFYSGDVFGYSGRGAGELNRKSSAWYVGEDVEMYAIHVINSANTLPDGILVRINDFGESFEKVYQAPDGYSLELLRVDTLNPRKCVCGQSRRSDGLDKSLILIDVVSKSSRVISTDVDDLEDITFVR